jgi:two-component system sensor histidine kinase BarA
MSFAGWPWLLWPLLLALGVTTVIAVITDFRAQAELRYDRTVALVPLLAQAAAPHIESGNREALARLARMALRLHPQLQEIEIRGSLGEQLGHARTGPAPEPGVLGRFLSAFDSEPVLRMTLESSPQRVARISAPGAPTVQLVLHPTYSDPNLIRRLRRFLICALLGLACGGAAAIYGLTRMARSQKALLDAARQLGQGRLEARAPVSAVGLTGEIAEAINLIGRQLLEAQDRYRGWMEQETGRLKRELAEERTQLRRMEHSVQESESAARVKSELYAQISHELRTPLAAIIGYSDLLRKAALPLPVAEQVNTLSKSAHGLLALVNDLLDWSRIEAGGLQLNESPFDLEDCVDDVVAMLAPLAYDKDLELVHILYHDVPRQLLGDAQRIKQVLTNLLSNAIKFTDRGEVVLRVMKDREEPRQLNLLLRVSDTGVGLAAEQQRQLFQPYRQVGSKSGSGGSGLGLVITRRLAELMGGGVTVESAPGQGATFSASLVLARQPEPPSAAFHDDLRGYRVWVYEPHTTARLALLHSFEYWGMEVRELGSLAEVRDAAQRAGAPRPDLVVLGLSAAEAGQLAQAQSQAGSALPALSKLGVPVLCLAASASQNLHESLRQAGASRCLPKSTGRSSLYQSLRELVSGEVLSPVQLTGRRVLVADNNVANRRYIVALLQGLGATTVEAADGREAVDRWTESRPDAVLLDVHMPVLDGLAAAREIRAKESGSRRSLIVGISAYLDPSERRALALAGMDGDLLKPFDERQLLRFFARRLPVAAPVPVREQQEPQQPSGKVTDRLVQDQEMRALLREELPNQLRELEDAFAGANLSRLREAAHQVHGTAAFYRLSGLKQAAAALEARVAQVTAVEAEPRLRDDMSALRKAVTGVLKQMQET